jgi:hypothetical protein
MLLFSLSPLVGVVPANSAADGCFGKRRCHPGQSVVPKPLQAPERQLRNRDDRARRSRPEPESHLRPSDVGKAHRVRAVSARADVMVI